MGAGDVNEIKVFDFEGAGAEAVVKELEADLRSLNDDLEILRDEMHQVQRDYREQKALVVAKYEELQRAKEGGLSK